MVHKRFASTFALSLSFLAACGTNKSASSKLDGHYEAATATSVREYFGQQRLVAEYEDSRGVIISLTALTSYGKEDMAKAILDSGVQTLWITVPTNYPYTARNSPDLANLRAIAGTAFSRVQLAPVSDAGSLTVWARDWAPLGALTNDGQLRLLDLNYYYDRNADDSSARGLEKHKILDFDRVSVPVYNEGGNFMNNEAGHCMMTTRVTDANDHQEQADDMILSNEQIKAYYKTLGGCTDVTIFPRMPYEGTGHIDMWAKFLDNNTLIVNEIRPEIFYLPYSRTELAKVERIRAFLEARIAEIQAMGYRVIRLPMPAPIFNSEEGDTFRSYTNSLTVNGHAITPRYVAPAFSGPGTDAGYYFDEHLRKGYEAESRAAYEALGYKFKWVESDGMIATGGAVHCTTMQIPL